MCVGYVLYVVSHFCLVPVYRRSNVLICDGFYDCAHGHVLECPVVVYDGAVHTAVYSPAEIIYVYMDSTLADVELTLFKSPTLYVLSPSAMSHRSKHFDVFFFGNMRSLNAILQ